jgi:putative endonuclease
MTLQHTVGNAGEETAARFLVSEGHEILCRNYRIQGAEIDLITLRSGILFIVEVKASRFLRSDYSPIERVDARKLGRLRRAAGRFLSENFYAYQEIRMAVIEVEGTETRDPRITFHDMLV